MSSYTQRVKSMGRAVTFLVDKDKNLNSGYFSAK